MFCTVLAWTQGFFDRSCWQHSPRAPCRAGWVRGPIAVIGHMVCVVLLLGRTWWLHHPSSCHGLCRATDGFSSFGIRAQAQQFSRKLWCRNRSKLWSFLCRSFHCTPGNKHVTFSSGKLHTALGFVQHRRLDVVGLGFLPGRADTWRQMLYSYGEFLEILSHHIGLCDQTKQKTHFDQLLMFLSFPWGECVFLESWDQSHCELPDRKKNCRKLHRFFLFYLR